MSEASPVRELHPLDAGLMEIGAPVSGLPFPPKGWTIIRLWGNGFALRNSSGLRAIIDCEQKDDDRWWCHLSVSRASRTPTHQDMCEAKLAFLGDRYAYAVHPPKDRYVNIHEFCLHLWCLVDAGKGQVLPNFDAVLEGVGRSI